MDIVSIIVTVVITIVMFAVSFYLYTIYCHRNTSIIIKLRIRASEHLSGQKQL